MAFLLLCDVFAYGDDAETLACNAVPVLILHTQPPTHPHAHAPPTRIALCSSTIDTNLFFAQFPHFTNGGLADLVVVTSTRVPLIKFTFHAVHVDLLFASVDLAEPPSNDDLLRDDFLFRVSENSRATVNGIRTILEIYRRLRLPQEDYACVLRAVKYWATRRQVYGNLYTFPNGVCLAIMVARASQLCPVQDPSALLKFFFALYVRWLSRSTPTAPITIVMAEDTTTAMTAVPGMTRAWDATRDAADLLPILNPARPTVNAAHTVGRSGLQLFYAELRRAHRLLQDHSATADAPPYRQLWQPYNVLQEYRYFVSVHIACVHASSTACESLLNVWKGFIESKLRIFLYALECVAEVRPFPQSVVDKPSDEIVGGGVTLRRASRAFFFGVRRGNSELQQSCFAEAFKEFRYAVAEGTTPPYGFERDEHSMLGPWFSFFAKEQTAAPGTALHALQAACAEAVSGAF
ncbi:putative poly(A) polymerase [Leptomonas pyrrhocoris]|uniref:polynucleotide adenylyltransferase n=1 Tax=Leptomonas pyrrhocoris TaxID=157538 RepID=A0A0M9G288_LEPPY|nr:putative poly(A) polymerase [Leptomonas pyrrhocoris]KPA80689.1 putative poly(A) polymerase [Leptomonas pyrrhocoris]|eukprot:XP_015659128.1 putative poly(A) polymerase [Leptomonas pyrrhocoris]